MHSSCLEWVAATVTEWDLAAHAALEVGSANVNGSVRPFFHGRYLGVDSQAGLGVDQVADAQALPFPAGSWPVVICTEVLEHVLRPWLVMAELARVCEPGGKVIVSARGYDERGCFPIHRYPIDVWRFSDMAMRVLAKDAGLEVLTLDADPWRPGWFLLAGKP